MAVSFEFTWCRWMLLGVDTCQVAALPGVQMEPSSGSPSFIPSGVGRFGTQGKHSTMFPFSALVILRILVFVLGSMTPMAPFHPILLV